MTDGVFSNTSTDDPLETLVGEGKKYREPKELAKAYLHADATIKERERELAELRQELQTRLTVEEQLARAQTREPNRVPDQPTQNQQKQDQTFSQADLDARILEVTSKATREAQAARNVEEVSQKLVTVYGDTAKANQVVRQKANELGVSVEFLLSSAAQSPKAFYAQLGLNSGTSNERPATSRPEVNSAAFVNTPGVKVGSYEYYEELRKSDTSRYFTPKVQNQLMKDAFAAIENGESWGGTSLE